MAGISGIMGGMGCSPRHYRQQADKEVYSLVRSAACESSQALCDYTILPDCRSRLHDPFDPDHEPMSRDDSCAHRLMHCVDCKKLRKCKSCMQTDWVESPFWRQYLNTDADGKVLLNKETALELALRHSPDYQRSLENVYLSALVVSNQRFRFDVQFWGGDSLFYNAKGEVLASMDPITGLRDTSSLTNDAGIGLTKTFATGGELAASFANSITWQFAGPDRVQAGSLFNLNIVQPLLRGAGKKIVLENLTQSERNLLANIRQMVFYRQGFYDRVMTGGGVSAPSGGQVSGTPGSVGIPASDSVSVGSASGYYGLLYDQVVIHNEEQHIVRVEDNLRRFEEAFAAGKTDRLSVEEVRNTLYRAQSTLLSRKTSYQTSVEAYLKDTIGLPPDLPVLVEDPLLEQFNLISKNLVDLQADTINILVALRSREGRIGDEILTQTAGSLERMRKELRIIDNDYKTLQNKVPERIKHLQLLEKRISAGAGESSAETSQGANATNMQIDPRLYSVAFFKQEVEGAKTRLDEQWENYEAFKTILQHLQTVSRLELLEQVRSKRLPPDVVEAAETLLLHDLLNPKKYEHEAMRSYADLLGKVKKNVGKLNNTPDNTPDNAPDNLSDNPSGADVLTDPDKRHETNGADLGKREETDEELPLEEHCFRYWVNQLIDQQAIKTLDISLVQAVIRLNSITLLPVSITPEEALGIASDHRLDWMNARAALVDQWRKIDVAANALKSDLSVELKGEAGTIDNDGLKFDAKNSSLSAGLVWDSPLNRHAERNAYRAALIEYQRARRSYYTYVDDLNASLRTTLRSLERQQVDFEVARASVFVSTMGVELAQFLLSRPPANAASKNEFDPSLATRLISKLSDLLDAQNRLLQLWVGYESLRMGLDLQMGTMQLDATGRWVDPGSITSESIAQHIGGGYAAVPEIPGLDALDGFDGSNESQPGRQYETEGIPVKPPTLAPPAVLPVSPPLTTSPHTSSSDVLTDLREMKELRDILYAAEPAKSEPSTPSRKEGASKTESPPFVPHGELKPSYANRYAGKSGGNTENTAKSSESALLRPQNAVSPDTLPDAAHFKTPLTARDAPPPPRIP